MTSEVESRFQLVDRNVVKVNHLILVLSVLTVLEYSNINCFLLNFVELCTLSPFLFLLNGYIHVAIPMITPWTSVVGTNVLREYQIIVNSRSFDLVLS